MVPQNKIILNWKFSSLKFLLKGYAALKLRPYRIVLIQDGIYVKRKTAAHLTDAECIARTRVSYLVFHGFISFDVYQNWNPVSFSFLQGRFFYAFHQVSLFTTDFSPTCVSTAEKLWCRQLLVQVCFRRTTFPKPTFPPQSVFSTVSH